MPPRALWSGSISFGLVNVPVRLFSAVSEHKLQFHFVHRKGKYVYMEDEDFKAARVEGYKTIDITDFVPYEQIDPIYFAHTYYVAPQDGSEKVYSLLVKAMEDSELAGIAKYVMRDRQYLGALRVREGTIALEQLHFADEIRPVEDIRPKRQRVAKGELDMARRLIDAFAGDWKPEKYRDTYRDALSKVIKAKQKGQEVQVAAEPEEEGPADLLEALRASVESSKRRERRPRRSSKTSKRKAA